MTKHPSTKAERRAARERNVQRWLRIVKSWGPHYTPEFIARYVRRAAGHGKLCSCDGCGNRRRTDGVTTQERRNAGFTLLELILVMLALFCLGSVAIVAYSRYLNLQQVCAP